ncbi:MAG: transporter associated domain-containing protein [Planctomycetota bacterium]
MPSPRRTWTCTRAFPSATRRDDPQSIVGYVNFKELVLLAKTHPHKPDIAEIVRPLGAFAEQLPVSEALRQLVADHHHLALVQDRRGAVVGLITLEDVFEELVGDIEDEFDRLPKHVSGSGPAWVMGGGVPLARVRQVLGDASLAAAARADTLLGDWLRAQHASPPHGGDVVVHGRARFTVRKVRRQRIVEVLVDVEQQTSASIAPH